MTSQKTTFVEGLGPFPTLELFTMYLSNNICMKINEVHSYFCDLSCPHRDHKNTKNMQNRDPHDHQNKKKRLM